jgi:SAM-dependent methyltransferase
MTFKHIPCDLCGKDEPEPLGEPEVSQKIREVVPTLEGLWVVRCKYCGFYYTDPMPFWNEVELQCLYDSDYFPPMSRWWEHQRIEVNPRRRLDIMEQHASSNITSFLEIGCGLGYGLEEAIKRGWLVWAQEVSHALARKARERLGIDIFEGQLQEADYPDSYFDAIYIDSVLEHLPQPMKMLEAIHRLLKPGGVAYITVTNEDALINRGRGLIFKFLRIKKSPKLSPLAYPHHIVGFTPDTFKRACESTNFDIRYIRVCSGRNEWHKYRKHDIGALPSSLIYYPIYSLGELIGKGIAIEAVLTPHKGKG